jgi:hypothetical protein
VAALNEKHDAISSRAAEAAIIDQVIIDVSTARKSELLEIHQGWVASFDLEQKRILIQRFKGSTDDETRRILWGQLKTLIHEYIHTMAHTRWYDYLKTITDGAKRHTLLEGVAEYLTKIVWTNIDKTSIRTSVEGTYTSDGPIPDVNMYRAAEEAEPLVGIVGARNLFAAYFLGDVELIGGTV